MFSRLFTVRSEPRRCSLRRPAPVTLALKPVAVVSLAVALFAATASAQVPTVQAPKPEPTTQESQRENYGRTPDRILPYGGFDGPYLRFFRKLPGFRGAGREARPTDHPTKSVRIGVMAPTGTAPDADLGRELFNGVTLAVEQANASGGYRGIPFETVVRADTGAWGSSANEMVSFRYRDNVLAVLGSIDGANTHIALRLALKTRMPMVNTATTDPTLTETGIPWIMRCIADDRQQGYALADHVFQRCGLRKVAAFRVNDRFGRTGIVEFRDAARRLKHPLRMELRWERGARAIGEQLDRIARANVEAVVLWGNASDAARVVKEMRRRHMPQRVFGCDRLVSRRFLEEAGAVAEGVVAVASFNPTLANPNYEAFVENYRKRFGHEPDTFAAHAFDGANILIESIRKGGLNRARIRDALYAYRRYEGVTGLIEFDTTLNDVGPVYIATVLDGRFVYTPARSEKTARSSPVTVPYRSLSQSPPTARVAQAKVAGDHPNGMRVGCFLPLDDRGRAAVDGLEMALTEEADHGAGKVPIELLVRDSRGAWGDDPAALTSLVTDESVLALVGSTKRRGTHLMETLAAKLHVPLITLCGDDPTIHAIPIPWVFSVAPARRVVDEAFARRFQTRFGHPATTDAAMGYDAGLILTRACRRGILNRTALRNRLANAYCDSCTSGVFHFDAWGRRVNDDDVVHRASSEEGNRGDKIMQGGFVRKGIAH